MRESWTEVLTGTLVLCVALGFAAFGLLRSGGFGGDGSYHLLASFRSAEGVEIGTDVRLAGVTVGSISDLTLNAETLRADAQIRLQGGLDLPDDSAFVIASEGLLGGNYVEIQPGGSPFTLADGDQVTDTQGAVSLINLLVKFVAGGGE